MFNLAPHSAAKFAKTCLLNSSSPGQNGRQFADDIIKRVFLNEKVWFLTKISLEFVPECPIDTNRALV